MPTPAKPKKSRRARGTGSIFYSERRGRYVARVPVGRKLDGSTHYVEVSAATERECVERMKAARPPGPGTTVAEWAERWFRELTIRASTKADYRNTLDTFILPTLGHIRATSLTAHQVEAAVRRWLERLGPNTARKNLGHLRACLEAARRAGLIDRNPAKDARRPKAKRVPIDPFPPAELARIIESPGAGILALLAAVGCRIGEALALDVADFDRATGEISITKTYCRQHGTRPPKSENGIRTVRVPRQALPAIIAAIGGRTKGPLFLSRDGRRRQHDSVRAEWAALLRRLGLRQRRPHQLRHSVATVWVSNGVPIGDVAQRLGDSVATVVRTYLHPTGADPSDAMERILDSGRKVGAETKKHHNTSADMKKRRA